MGFPRPWRVTGGGERDVGEGSGVKRLHNNLITRLPPLRGMRSVAQLLLEGGGLAVSTTPEMGWPRSSRCVCD